MGNMQLRESRRRRTARFPSAARVVIVPPKPWLFTANYLPSDSASRRRDRLRRWEVDRRSPETERRGGATDPPPRPGRPRPSAPLLYQDPPPELVGRPGPYAGGLPPRE